jgi:hypothetical protein
VQLLNPAVLVAPRVYFTEFDRVTYSQVAWTSDDVIQIKKDLERKVKLLALTKGFVVIATSHLYESELAREFLFENPTVLKEGIFVPALISKYSNFSDFLHDKRNSDEAQAYASRDVDEIQALMSDNVQAAITWDAKQTSSWFKRRLLSELANESSVLRLNLSGVPQTLINSVYSSISEQESPSRGKIYGIGKKSGNNQIWTRLSEYADFTYYLSGAMAVNSEGVLPQEHLIDFSLADIDAGRTRLSEYDIFYKLLLSIVHEQTHKIFPIEILDALDFDDIIQLRKNLLHTDFVDKYNALMRKVKGQISIEDTEQLVLTVSELAEFEAQLYKIFQDTVINEMSIMKKIDIRKRGSKVLTSTASFLTFYGALESIVQMAVNTLSFMGFDTNLSNAEERIKSNLQRIEKLIDRSELEKKPVLIKFLGEITQKYSSKLI